MEKRRDRKAGKRLAALLCAALLFSFAICVPALASVPDRPANKYVLDSAGVLEDSTEEEIIRENTDLFEQTGAEIVVVAVDFLGGQDIRDYANDLFNEWGIGSSQRNNGILLVLAIGEDNYYATSGYGLEDYFDGARFRELLDECLEPDFAAKDYDAGVRKFFRETLEQVEGYYKGYQDEYSPDGGYAYYEGGGSYSYSPLSRLVSVIANVARIVIVMVVLIVIIRIFSGRGRGGRGGPPYGGGGGGFWSGMLLGGMLNRRHRPWGPPPPPPPPGGFGGRRPPGGFGGFTGGGRSGGFGGGRPGGFSGGRGGGFSGGGRSHGGGAGRR